MASEGRAVTSVWGRCGRRRRRVQRRRGRRHRRVTGRAGTGRKRARWRRWRALGGVDLHREGHFAAEVPGQGRGDRFAQSAFDGLLGEVARGRQQCGTVQQADGAGHPHPCTLLWGQRSLGELCDNLFPDDSQVQLVLRHAAPLPSPRPFALRRLSGASRQVGVVTCAAGIHIVVHNCAPMYARPADPPFRGITVLARIESPTFAMACPCLGGLSEEGHANKPRVSPQDVCGGKSFTVHGELPAVLRERVKPGHGGRSNAERQGAVS